MTGRADNLNGELESYITGADTARVAYWQSASCMAVMRSPKERLETICCFAGGRIHGKQREPGLQLQAFNRKFTFHLSDNNVTVRRLLGPVNHHTSPS